MANETYGDWDAAAGRYQFNVDPLDLYDELTERLMAAYQFITPALGNPQSLADIRLYLSNVESHRLNALLRELNGSVVPFWFPGNDRQQQCVLSLREPQEWGQEATWRELDEGIEIGSVTYTYLSVHPCG